MGGVDGVAGVYSIMENRLVRSLKAGGGAIKDGVWWGDRAVVATASGAVKIFEDGAETARFTTHAGSADALAMHPSGELLASVGADKSYVFYDLAGLKPLTQVFTDSGECLAGGLVHAGIC